MQTAKRQECYLQQESLPYQHKLWLSHSWNICPSTTTWTLLKSYMYQQFDWVSWFKKETNAFSCFQQVVWIFQFWTNCPKTEMSNQTPVKCEHPFQAIFPITWSDSPLHLICAHTVQVLALSSFGSPLLKPRWAGVAVCCAPGTCGAEWGNAVHRCRISCDAHPIKRGRAVSPINRSPFQTALCSPTLSSWQQLAATTRHSSPAYTVRYCVGRGLDLWYLLWKVTLSWETFIRNKASF